MAGDSIGRLSLLISGNIQGLQAATNRARSEVASLVRGTTGMFGGAGGGLFGGLGAVGGAIFPQLAAAASLAGAVAMFKSLSDEAERFLNTSQELGTSAVFLQQLAASAELGGSSFEKVESALTKMSQQVGAAFAGSEEAAAAFGKIGLSVNELAGMAPDEQFQAIARSLMSIENPALRAHYASQVFGRGWREIGPVLADAAAGLDQFKGVAVSAESLSALADAGDALTWTWQVLKADTMEMIGTILQATFGLGEEAKTASQLEAAKRREAAARREALEVMRREAMERETQKILDRQYQEEVQGMLQVMERQAQMRERLAETGQAMSDSIDAALGRGPGQYQRQVENLIRDMADVSPAMADAARGPLAELARIQKEMADLTKAKQELGRQTAVSPAQLATRAEGAYEVFAKVQTALATRDDQVKQLAEINAKMSRLIEQAARQRDTIKSVSMAP